MCELKIERMFNNFMLLGRGFAVRYWKNKFKYMIFF